MDKVHALTVILEKDMSIDDVQPLISAIGELRHVAKVDRHITNLQTVMAQEQARVEIRERISKVLWPKNRRS